MTMNPHTYSALSDELTKIALAGKALRGAGKLVSKGWEDMGRWMGNPQSRWFAKKGPSGELTGGIPVGKVTRYLPIGGKSLTVGATGAMVPSALSDRDPMGRGRSKTQRLSQLAGGTIGGLAGLGLALKGGKAGFLKSMAGGIGGSIAGEYAAGVPFRAAKKLKRRPVIPYEKRRQFLRQAVGGRQ